MQIKDAARQYRKLAAASRRGLNRGRVSTTDSQQRAERARTDERYAVARHLPEALLAALDTERATLNDVARDEAFGGTASAAKVAKAKTATKAANALVKNFS